MPSTQRIILFIASVCFLIIVLRFIRRQHLSVSHSLLWLVLGIAGIAAALIPSWVFALSGLLGFELPVNLIFFVCIFFLIVAVLSISMVASSQADMIRSLVQEVSLLTQRVEMLERRQRLGATEPAGAEAIGEAAGEAVGEETEEATEEVTGEATGEAVEESATGEGTAELPR